MEPQFHFKDIIQEVKYPTRGVFYSELGGKYPSAGVFNSDRGVVYSKLGI